MKQVKNYHKISLIASIIITLIVLVFMLSGTSCTKIGVEKVYVIKANKHHSNRLPKFYNKESVLIYFRVDSSWLYEPMKPDGWHKIGGFSEGNHHKSSARITYQCRNGDEIHLAGYAYVNDTSPQQDRSLKPYIGRIRVGEYYYCRIDRMAGRNYFDVWAVGYDFHTTVDCRAGKGKIGYLLYPHGFLVDHDRIFPVTFIKQ